MKYTFFSLLALLICALALTGCDRSQITAEKNEEEEEISLELSTEQPEEDTTRSPDETLTLLRPEDEGEKAEADTASSGGASAETNDAEPKQEGTEPAAEQTVETPVTESPITGSEALPFSAELMTRPSAELSDNPQKLDTRLYAVFQNVMEQNFSRKEGKLFVYRLNGDGTEGAYELSFDLNNAYDEKGLLNKNAAVTAEMKVGETLESGFNYGQGSRETFSTYAQYAETLDWLRTPLLTDGFALKNFSSLKFGEEDGSYRIEAVYLPAALQQLYEMDEVVGTVTAYLEIDAEGNVKDLGWEQIEVIDDYPTRVACSEYTFQ